MRAFVRLEEKPASPEKLREFIAKCRNADGGYGVTPGQESSASGTYYAGIILHWLAAAQFVVGQRSQALETQRLAAALRPRDAEVARQLREFKRLAE